MVAVFGLFVRAVLGFYARRGKARGLPGGQTGAVTFVQRFGSAANLHVHAHVLVMDGVFTQSSDGELTFHKLPAPSDRELHDLLATVRRRVIRHLRLTVATKERRACRPLFEAWWVAWCVQLQLCAASQPLMRNAPRNADASAMGKGGQLGPITRFVYPGSHVEPAAVRRYSR
jgi:hypothetical protein